MGISKLQGLWVTCNPHKFEIPALQFPYKPPVNPCKHLQCSIRAGTDYCWLYCDSLSSAGPRDRLRGGGEGRPKKLPFLACSQNLSRIIFPFFLCATMRFIQSPSNKVVRWTISMKQNLIFQLVWADLVAECLVFCVLSFPQNERKMCKLRQLSLYI